MRRLVERSEPGPVAVVSSSLQRARHVLFVASTFGDGEAPDNAHAFCRQVMSQQLPLAHLRYGLLALGDSSYDLFCGFGRSLEDWLHSCGAQPLFDSVLADDGDRVLVRPDRAVGAEPVEDGALDVGGFGVERVVDAEGGVGDVVDDADGEAAPRLLCAGRSRNSEYPPWGFVLCTCLMR